MTLLSTQAVALEPSDADALEDLAFARQQVVRRDAMLAQRAAQEKRRAEAAAAAAAAARRAGDTHGRVVHPPPLAPLTALLRVPVGRAGNKATPNPRNHHP